VNVALRIVRCEDSRCYLYAYQRLQDELNDLGQQGWELTAVTDEGDAKIFILKQPDEIIVEPSAQA
jgi:hypothetical protein